MSDAQVGYDKTITALLPALAGANIIYGTGMIEMGMTLSLAQLVMDNEMAFLIKRIVRGISLEDELMGVHLIKKVGIGGNFLAQRHSLNHIGSEQSQGGLFDRNMRGKWEKRGSQSLDQVAKEKAKDIVANHKPLPLPEGVAEEFKKIIKSAESK